MNLNNHTVFSIFLLVIVFSAGLLVGYLASHEEPGKCGWLCKALSERQTVLVTQVVDGDTITVEGGTRIRLLGIDAPEKGEDFYAQATDFLKEMILHEEIETEKDITDKDQYGRFLRYIWLDDKLIDAEIVRAGLAVAKQYEPDIKYQNIIAKAEQEALANKVGIWSK